MQEAPAADPEVGSKRKADDDGCGEEWAGAGAGPDAKRAATVDDDRRLSLIDSAFGEPPNPTQPNPSHPNPAG